MREFVSDENSDTPNVAAGYRFSEPFLRRFLAMKLAAVRRDVDNPRVHFLSDLFGGFGGDTVRQVRDWWRLKGNVEVRTGWPRLEGTVPSISIVNAGDQIREDLLVMGDEGGVQYRGTPAHSDYEDDGTRGLEARQILTVPFGHTTQIYILAQDDLVALYLYTVVMALFVRHRVDLIRYFDMHDVTLSGGDVQPDQNLSPNVVFQKVVTLSYVTWFDVPEEATVTVGAVLQSLFTGDPDAPVQLE